MNLISKHEMIQSRNGYDIHMIVTEPMNKRIRPCIIFLHGTCSNMNEVGNSYVYLANQLASHGYTVIRFDFVGSGKSSVDSIHYSFESAISDTHDVIEYAKGIGCREIGLVGWSQGATIALLASNDSISSVVTLSCALDFSNIATKFRYQDAKENGYAWYDPGFTKPVKLSLKWIEEVMTTDVLECYSHKHKPTLAIHGTQDRIVDPICSKMTVDASNHPKSKVIYMNECDHIFNVLTHQYDYFKVVSNEMITWLNDIYF